MSLRNHYLGAFVQEERRVRPTLTVNLGLRYELETPWGERYDRMSFAFDSAATFPAKVAGLDLRPSAT